MLKNLNQNSLKSSVKRDDNFRLSLGEKRNNKYKKKKVNIIIFFNHKIHPLNAMINSSDRSK